LRVAPKEIELLPHIPKSSIGFPLTADATTKYTNELMYSIKKNVLLHNMFSLDEAHDLTLEAEEMVIRPSSFMRSYQSNKITEQHQQSPIEEQSTKRDSSSIDMPTTNNQMSGRGIQTNVTLVQIPQVAVVK